MPAVKDWPTCAMPVETTPAVGAKTFDSATSASWETTALPAEARSRKTSMRNVTVAEVIKINRLDPHVPDPVESRRRAAGRVVRFAYAMIVFAVVAFFVVYSAHPLSISADPASSRRRASSCSCLIPCWALASDQNSLCRWIIS
ncbi:hypothetical protein [Bradyrhizobium sp. BR 10261]|uniref:hypothetical protein n=1 Tax=Bradyrhizobium sp. BR 10261 TaxID=2749992 RepID=UPI001E283D02|nr:hypothetical protein [Bradyrhizobium sp. BR 10261]